MTIIVLYGHKKNERFRYIPDLNEGDLVTLETWSGNTYDYQVSDLELTSPGDVSAVSPTNYEKLTIYTCYGLVDGERFIVTAEPKIKE